MKSISLLLLILLFIGLLQGCSPSIGNQVFYQPIQKVNEAHYVKDVVRIYMDKFGYFYPDTNIAIYTSIFFDMKGKGHLDSDTTNGNLYHYFTNDEGRLKSLREFYKIPYDSHTDKVYHSVENRIIKTYADSISRKLKELNADQIVFLIHGFNVDNATSSFKEIRDTIKSYGYDKNDHNLYVEVFWDGLKNLAINATSIIPIWAHAQNNSIYVGLSVRNLITELDPRIPLVFITHSLGASVATEALFNTTHKWSGARDPKDAAELKRLLKIQTPDNHHIRLGMLAPAIPGQSTFIDFDERSPRTILPAENNIYPIVIGYNPKDYAVSKWFLAHLIGTTTLGSNAVTHHRTEIENVRKIFVDSLQYKQRDVDNLLTAIHFTTVVKIKSLGLQDHSLHSYLNYAPDTTRKFFKKLLGD
jgi:hypothetical protein